MSSGAEEPSSLDQPACALSADGKGRAAASEFDRRTATFRDPALESEYRSFLATESFRREFQLQWVGVAAFLSYGFLDLLTVGDKAADFLILRCAIVGPIGALGVMLTAIPRLRPYQQYSTIIGFALYCLSIIFMISAMSPVGGPPYIIGVLVTMIFTSCLMRVKFPVAAFTYLFVSVVYCAVVAAHAHMSATDRIAGYFFMISVAMVAIVTSYVQEMRAREIWYRNRQREKDAAEIRRLLIEATAADQSKLNFLSVLTHELRTPLHQIIGFSEIARADAANAAAAAQIANINQALDAARELLKKIGQMLRYADATAGKLSFVIDDVLPHEIIEQLTHQYSDLATRRSVQTEVVEIGAAKLLIDAHHTLYALGNILENALNASPPGAKVIVTGALAGDGLYKISVRDFGPGMSPAKIAAALEPFGHADSKLSRTQKGLGLGVSIAKQLIERQGGSLTISSVENVGTTVEVTCPVLVQKKSIDTA
ncbi:MAG: HAMP domain-containing sensor histidine kinase [Parvularculaceae bacterium]|nr:HAMP domain-containing sensor histidine kinase [Parvularculaceae bacterium]